MTNGTERGIVININTYGATVRLNDGRLASASLTDLEKNRAAYERALTGRKTLEFVVQATGRHANVFLAPQLRDDQFEEQIANYLKMTEEWEKPDSPPAHERHFLRKKKRAALFESRHSDER
jgi:succinate dehydrogenase/fumarate reductase flavoprotein subunit